MENSTSFDLDQALGQWRASLQNLGGFQAEELEELEGHLRESIALLHARGLSIEEAFAIATWRLGSERQLSAEFAKANPQRLWTERAMWMVIGVLAALVLRAVTAPIATFGMNCALWSGVNEHLAAALHLLTGWILWSGAAGSAYWILSRHSSSLDRLVRVCLQRPVLTGLGLFIGLQCLQYGMGSVNRFAAPVYNFFTGRQVAPYPQITDMMSAWFVWGSLLTLLLWIAAGPLLAGYAWRKCGRPESAPPVSHELQPGEYEAARALQGYGLSLEEAGLILARRRCPQDVVAPSRMLSTDRGIWLERTAWMVMGVALSQCLEMLVVIPGLVLAIATQPVAPLAQHLAVLGSACLALALAGAIIAGLWRWVTRHPRQSASIGKFCRHQPLLAALALIVVCAGIPLFEYALVTCLEHFKVLPASGSIEPIGGLYFRYSAPVTHLIIPIALLLWLARRWRSIQTHPAPCR
jgi:hypothetical protein